MAGDLDAAGLAAELRAAPSAPTPRRRTAPSWRWAIAAGALVAVALVVALLGSALRVRPSDSPFLFPAIPVTTAPSPTTTTLPPPGPPDVAVVLAVPSSYDPFGDETEREADIRAVVDGDPATAWRTDLYFDPLPRVKQGVGISFRVAGSPAAVDIVATEGTRYSLAWSTGFPRRFADWEETVAGTILGGRATHRLPARPAGVWLLWLTELPSGDTGDTGDTFYADVYEVRFLS
jgi:putative peptidoglycan lipid II flippase